MRIIIAPNSFKDCLGAREVAEALARGIRSKCPGAEIEIVPLSDGGDGLVSVLAGTLNGTLVETDTFDALGRPVKAEWLKTGERAIIEMALASGLARLAGPSEYDPLINSTFGTGVLVGAALDAGCRDLVIGLGGSATVDAGCGMALALGFRLEDSGGNLISRGGGLNRLARVRPAECFGAFREGVKVTALADVMNPLLGSEGAARTFAPQKGASPEDVELLEDGLTRWASIIERDLGISVAGIPGSGAAGGLGAGCVAFMNARLEPGAVWVAAQSGLPQAIRRGDIVLTGEGKIDSQTRFGKVPAYVGRLAAGMNKPVVAFGGLVEEGLDPAQIGAEMCVRVSPEGMALDEAIRGAAGNLEEAAARSFGRIEELAMAG